MPAPALTEAQKRRFKPPAEPPADPPPGHCPHCGHHDAPAPPPPGEDKPADEPGFFLGTDEDDA